MRGPESFSECVSGSAGLTKSPNISLVPGEPRCSRGRSPDILAAKADMYADGITKGQRCVLDKCHAYCAKQELHSCREAQFRQSCFAGDPQSYGCDVDCNGAPVPHVRTVALLVLLGRVVGESAPDEACGRAGRHGHKDHYPSNSSKPPGPWTKSARHARGLPNSNRLLAQHLASGAELRPSFRRTALEGMSARISDRTRCIRLSLGIARKCRGATGTDFERRGRSRVGEEAVSEHVRPSSSSESASPISESVGAGALRLRAFSDVAGKAWWLRLSAEHPWSRRSSSSPRCFSDCSRPRPTRPRRD